MFCFCVFSTQHPAGIGIFFSVLVLMSNKKKKNISIINLLYESSCNFRPLPTWACYRYSTLFKTKSVF